MLEYTKGTQSTPSVAFILITVTVMKTQVIMKSYKKQYLLLRLTFFFYLLRINDNNNSEILIKRGPLVYTRAWRTVQKTKIII